MSSTTASHQGVILMFIFTSEGLSCLPSLYLATERRSDLFRVPWLQECLTGLQLDRTDHETSHSLPAAPSG